MTDEPDETDEFNAGVAQVVAALVTKHGYAINELPGVIAHVKEMLRGKPSVIRKKATPRYTTMEMPTKGPAVPIERSVHDEYLVCLEDGKRVKYLKSYLERYFHMSPDQYITRWSLPHDYPFTAPKLSREKLANLTMQRAKGKVV